MSEADENHENTAERPLPQRSTAFATRFWGYDRAAVDQRLTELEAAVQRLTRERDAAAAGPELVGVGEKVEEIIASAREAAAEARAQAAAKSAELSRESEEAAEQLRREADEYSSRVRGEADAHAASTRSEVDAEASEARQKASTEADALVAAAEQEAEEMVREARLEQGRIEDSIAELRDRRQQVIDSIERLKGSLSSMVGEAERGTSQFLAVEGTGVDADPIEEETDLLEAASDPEGEPLTDEDDAVEDETAESEAFDRNRRLVYEDETEERAVRTEDL